MSNPFPGMNPYLEDAAHWTGVHHSLMTYIRDALQPQLPAGYIAILEERVYLDAGQTRIPDVFVIERLARETQTPYLTTMPLGAAGVVLAEPLLVGVPPLETREAFIQIVLHDEERVVTVIEVLSPTNKTPGEGRRQYVDKQQELLESQVNLVEIDLLGDGLPTLAVVRGGHSSLPPHRYLINVRRLPKQYLFEVYPLPLQDTLPNIRIPLHAPDPDVALNVQAVLNLTYENGAYDRRLKYREPPRTTLSAPEEIFVEEVLRAKNLR